jgi:hypothetical protein
MGERHKINALVFGIPVIALWWILGGDLYLDETMYCPITELTFSTSYEFRTVEFVKTMRLVGYH